MHLSKLLFILPAILIIMGIHSSTSGADKNCPHLETGKLCITGKIAIKGNEPVTWVALVTPEGVDYRLKGKLLHELRSRYQQQEITLSGKVISRAKGPGLPAGFEVEAIVE